MGLDSRVTERPASSVMVKGNADVGAEGAVCVFAGGSCGRGSAEGVGEGGGVHAGSSRISAPSVSQNVDFRISILRAGLPSHRCGDEPSGLRSRRAAAGGRSARRSFPASGHGETPRHRGCHPWNENPLSFRQGDRWVSEHRSHPLSSEGSWDHRGVCSWLWQATSLAVHSCGTAPDSAPGFHVCSAACAEQPQGVRSIQLSIENLYRTPASVKCQLTAAYPRHPKRRS